MNIRNVNQIIKNNVFLITAFLLVALICFMLSILSFSGTVYADEDSFNHSGHYHKPKDPSETIPPRARTQAAIEADEFFWFAFNNGKYELIGQVLDALVGAYLNDPEDALTAGHIGSTHLWRLSEKTRLDVIPPTITDSIIMARKYLGRSVDLYPNNAIFLGQFGGMMMAEAQVDFNDELYKRGLKIFMQSAKDWPEFNLFTIGYIFNREFRSDDKEFLESLEMQWENLEICVGEKINRDNPDFTPFLALLEINEGRKRVCWNNDKAPHNTEGFFMNMGDMLVKSGDWQTALKIYANARIIPSYSTWKYRDELEDRITDASLNVDRFNANPDSPDGEYKPVMSAESYACSVCHKK